MAYTDYANGFRSLGLKGAGEAPVFQAQVDKDATVTRGDFVIDYGSAGYLGIALATSTVLIGLMMEAVTADAATYPWADYIPAFPDVVFLGQCSGTPTISNLWAATDIEGTTGIMEINEDSTTYGVIVPFELWDKTSSGGFAANAKLKFVVKKSIWNISA